MKDTDPAKKPYNKTEKRAHDRYACELTVGIAPTAGGDMLPGTATNISMGGLLIETQAELEFGQEVNLLLDLPGTKDTSKIVGIVRWVSPARGVGVHFKVLRAADTLALSKFVRRLSEEGDPV